MYSGSNSRIPCTFLLYSAIAHCSQMDRLKWISYTFQFILHCKSRLSADTRHDWSGFFADSERAMTVYERVEWIIGYRHVQLGNKKLCRIGNKVCARTNEIVYGIFESTFFTIIEILRNYRRICTQIVFDNYSACTIHFLCVPARLSAIIRRASVALDQWRISWTSVGFDSLIVGGTRHFH